MPFLNFHAEVFLTRQCIQLGQVQLCMPLSVSVSAKTQTRALGACFALCFALLLESNAERVWEMTEGGSVADFDHLMIPYLTW